MNQNRALNYYSGKKQVSNGLLVVLTAFMLLYFLFNDLGIRYVYGYALLCIALIVVFLSTGAVLVITTVKLWLLCLVIPVALFSFLPTANKDHELIAVTVSMLVFAGFALFVSAGETEIRWALQAIQLVAVGFAAYLLVTKAMPSLYWNSIYPHLSSAVKDAANEYIPDGYGVPIGGSTTYADYVMSIALLYNLSKFLLPGALKNNRAKVPAVLGMTLLFLMGMLAQNRRSELISMVLTAIILFFFSLDFKRGREYVKKVGGIVAGIIVAAIIIALLARVSFLSRYIKTFQMLVSGGSHVQSEVTNGRMDLWRIAGELFLKNPLIGIGWNQFRNYNPGQLTVHNNYLQWLCESGVIGFVLIMVPILALFIMSFRQMLQSFKDETSASVITRQMIFVSTGMQLFFLILHFIDPVFYHQNYFCFYGFAVILADTALNEKKASEAS